MDANLCCARDAADLTDRVWGMEEVVALMDEAALKPGRPMGLLDCLVRRGGRQPNHRQGHVDLLGERPRFHNLALAMVGNARQRRGADCPYVIERQRSGVKKPLRR
jgi:hypothetical protein